MRWNAINLFEGQNVGALLRVGNCVDTCLAFMEFRTLEYWKETIDWWRFPYLDIHIHVEQRILST